ncbi:hypothetical protein [Winogradskyella sp. UBA3174]|uniref:hypothetical protein n=1 Tax=Winogradskyella sp. UBA3174 TaxID=1947785 RepID=UPI0025F0D7CC|nr:hypothetical protein [Winogradskyella sp. UBA3174]|tara:strand:- start:14534 stop:14773 length:240 start_codon:yes stop_codon:yes gene_type:complete
MKKLIASIVFLLIATTISFGQTKVSSSNVIETEKINKEVLVPSEVCVSSELRAKLLKINPKKSNDIISIKSYRKSLKLK